MSAPDRMTARVGDLEFTDRYGDPTVDVTTQANSVEHDVLNDEIIVQYMGRRADRVSIDGIIYEDDVQTLDTLVDDGEVSVRTQRWSGTGIVEQTRATYTHSYDIAPESDVRSEWLYEVTIDLVEVEEIPVGTPVGGGTPTSGNDDEPFVL